jgi:voltage-gated potassium channel
VDVDPGDEKDQQAAPVPAPRRPLNRAETRFRSDPSSPRKAVYYIVVADVAIVLIGGSLIWLLDRQEYAHIGDALWYTLQTITTVGYGDVTPADPIGRIVGAAIMMLGIAFLSILTATITSSFIEARQAARQAIDDEGERDDQRRLEARLDELIERLDRLEVLARQQPERSDT